ncbi:MAG: DNA gyrase inhibitor YacG [Caulobacteraceae bacterium]|nr:DNA gyrase inhibitor YacG [Caulobacteraceae bacterium]
MTDRPCPICGKPAKAEARPFCSRRCASIDLQRWLSGAYAVPAAEDESAARADELGEASDPDAAARRRER